MLSFCWYSQGKNHLLSPLSARDSGEVTVLLMAAFALNQTSLEAFSLDFDSLLRPEILFI